MNFPKDLFYSKEHEWVQFDGQTARVGITDFAQDSLGDVVFVELPEIGTKVSAGAEAATVESVKAVSPIYSPIAGKIIETNSNLEDSPQLLNEAPYDSWVFVVELDSPSGPVGLMNADEYEAFCNK